MIAGFVVVAALAAAAWSPADAPALAPTDAEAIAAIVEDARALSPKAALSLGVITGDAVFRGAWGTSDAASRPVAPEASYRVASITKTFTAIVAMQLASEGRLDLDADVRRWVPAYPARPWPITPRQLLAHTSGIPHYRSTRDALTRSPLTTTESLAIFAERRLASPPGTRFLYSSFGYNLLGNALESASGEGYEALLHERIFDPLGMIDTGVERGPRRAHDVDGFRIEGGRLVPSERIDISSRFASGGARSTVDDLLRYSRALIDGSLVDEASWRTMTTPTVTPDGRQVDYGLGFSVYPYRGHAVIAHAGGQPEVSSLLLLVPEERTAIVLLMNIEGQGKELHRLAGSILEVLLDGGAPQRELYADDVVDDISFDGMRRIFSWGLAAPSPAEGRDDPALAFAALAPLFSTERMRAQPDIAKQAIAEAFQPFSGRVTQRVGAEMTRVLMARGAARSTLRAQGPLAFFSAYVDACPGAPDLDAPECRHALPPELAGQARRLDAAWRATPPALALLRPERVAHDFDALQALVGSPVHPSFRDDLERAAARLRAAGRTHDAQRALALSAALHPRAPRTAAKGAKGATSTVTTTRR